MKTTPSSSAQKNLDTLIAFLQARLQSNGKTKSADKCGNTTYVDCDIYSKETLASFIELAISSFNQTPYFTSLSLDDTKFVDCFAEVLVEGATLYALSSRALIERGREFKMIDNEISFDPPAVSELLNTQFSTLLGHHWSKLQLLKSHFDMDREADFKKK